MSNSITSSKPACYLSYKTRTLPVRKHQNYQLFGNHQISHPVSIKFKVHLNYIPSIRAKGNSEDSDEEAPAPKKSHFSAWKKWAAGLMLSLILPSYRHKIGPFMLLKTKVDATIETVETVVDAVEDLAEAVEKLADELEDRLPEDAKLKEAAHLVEDLARQADKKAEQAQAMIQQVKAAERELEEMMDLGRDDDKDQPSKKIS